MSDRRAELFQLLSNTPPPKAINERWADYAALGISPNDIPELTEILSGEALYETTFAAEEIIPEAWIPLHCARALGQLRAVEAAPTLLSVLEADPDDDWYDNDLPTVMALIGPAALPALTAFLADEGRDELARWNAVSGISAIGQKHPEIRDGCVRIFEGQLTGHGQTKPGLSGMLVAGLIDLKAVGAIDTISQAYQAEHVDFSVCGDLEDVEIELGLRAERSTPPPKISFFRDEEALYGDEDIDDGLGFSRQSPSRSIQQPNSAQRKNRPQRSPAPAAAARNTKNAA